MNRYPVHPLVRVVVLLVFTTGMALAQPAVLLAGTVLLMLGFTLAGFPAIHGLVMMVLRLRWLLLALLVVYGWWTPGEILFPGLGSLSPTLPGLRQGLLRVTALVCIISAVHLLIQTTERGQLLAALMLITGPLLHPQAKERFAVRLLLTLESVGQVQQMMNTAVQRKPENVRGLSTMAFCVKTVYAGALERAGHAAGMSLDVADPETPPRVQWLLPLLLAVGMGLVAVL